MTLKSSSALLCIFTLLCIVATATQAESPTPGVWGQFRGPQGMGVASSDSVGLNFETPAFRTPLRGVGWSSPVTDGQRVWLTSAIVTEATQEQRKAKLAKVQMANMKDVAGSIELLAQCVDATSGEILFEKSLGKIGDPNPIHPMNSYASPTPALVGDRLICHFGGYGTWCLDATTGETIWTQRLVVDDSVGPGSSPIVVDDIVLLVCDGIDKQFVAGVSLSEGEVLWQTPRPKMRTPNGEFQKAYCTPLIIEVDGETQAVIPGAQWIVAYDPATGREHWRADHGSGFSVTPMPIYAGGLVVFSTGYITPELVAVDPTGRGDVTQTHVRWRINRGVPAKPSPISDGQLVYLVSDDGIVTAVSLADGASRWRKRIGGTFSASPLLSGDKLFIANHDGEITVFRAGGEYQEIKTADLGEQVMASPVPVGSDLLIRTKAALYRFANP
ncbi:PQQ-binding-like beta-propeller repeat protein [Stieleria varia]|uniref:Outer membrane biogenesis protein BamB n=1 Tax=Stieleria varia TaxID=2528005 RepID=A0A5C5ZQ85_9BACT|nr:PQQ-binding-like beta-propeller repeat protein [Stieleria varia]TWT89255.1 outer membrane biogenesis protein BamB [Stieleria varia]